MLYSLVMDKKIIRVLLLSAAVIFTINLILFSYGQWLIFPLLGALFLLVSVSGLGFSYLLINFSELERLQQGYANLTVTEEEKLFLFMRSLVPVFRQGSACLYKIN